MAIACMSKVCRLFLLAALLCACTPPPQTVFPSPLIASIPPGFPAIWYHNARASGEQVLNVDTANSLVEIDVLRAGPLAQMGHDHVVSSRQLNGLVAPRLGQADLYVQLDSLNVDEPELRRAAGMEGTPSAEDIEATRRNMLDKVLETRRFPFALIKVLRVDGQSLTVALTLHGVTQTQQIPAQIRRLANGIEISGALAIRQTDFGITPMSVMGGGLRVEDILTMRFRVRAKP